MNFIQGLSKREWPYSPQSLPNCLLWLDATDKTSYRTISSFNLTLFSLRNKGFAGENVGVISNVTVDASANLFKFGTNGYITAPSLTFATTDRTVFLVCDVSSSGSAIQLMSSSIPVTAANVQLGSTGTNLQLTVNGNNIYTAATPLPFLGIRNIVCAATNSGLYLTGNIQDVSSAANTYTTGTTTTQRIGGTGAAFSVGEVLIFDGTLATEQRQQIEGYLANKWGLVAGLPLTHPYSNVTTILLPGIWPKFRYNNSNTGLSPYLGSQTNALKWQSLAGNEIQSSPAIGSDGTIYVGSYDGKLCAFKPDGSTKWKSAVISYIIYSSPAIGSDGTIYIGSSNFQAATDVPTGKLWAFYPDGSTKWQSAATGGSIFSSPAIGSDGTIYVGSYDGKLWAFNLDGSTKWQSAPTGGIIFSSPAIGSDGTIYIGSNDGKLWAFKPDGSTKWESAATGGSIDSSPAIGSDGTIYIGSYFGKKLWAFKPDGSTKWQSAATGDVINSSPAIGSDGTIYIGSQDRTLWAFKPDGSTKWQSAATGHAILSSPAIGSDGTIYIGSFDGKLWAFKPDGSTKWESAATGNSIQFSSPAIGSDGTIYIGSRDGKLWAFGPQTLTPQPIPTPITTLSLPVIPYNRPFQPTDICGCQLWLDGGDGSTVTTVGSSVTAWNDKSLSQNNMYNISGTVVYVPTGIGSPYLQFQSTGMLQTANYVTISTGASLFVVCQNTTLSAANTPTNYVVACPDICAGNYGVRFYGAATTPTGASPVFLYSGTANDIGFNPGTYFVNGTLGNPDGSNRIGLPNTNSINLINGTFGTGGLTRISLSSILSYFVGNIQEVILYQTTLTRSQRIQIEAYLAQKWQLSFWLPTGHPGKSLPAIGTAIVPKSTNTVSLWLDAADPLTVDISNSEVAVWRDKSGLQNDVYDICGTVTYTTTTGYPSLQFQSGSILRTSKSLTVSPGGVVFIVCQNTAITSVAAPTNYVFTLSDISSGNYAVRFYYPTNDLTAPYLSDVSASDIGFGSASSTYYVNGTYGLVNSFGNISVPTGPIVIVGRFNSAISGSTRISLSSLLSNFVGNIYEVIVCTSLSTFQQRQIEKMLAQKWKINYQVTLPQLLVWPTFHLNSRRTGLSPYASLPYLSPLWTFNTGAAINYSSPVIGLYGIVYVGSMNGSLYAISSSGNLLWKYDTNGAIMSTPAIGPDGTVYVGSNDTYLYAISPATIGTAAILKWKTKTGGAIKSSPAISSDASGTIYVGSEDGYVHAFNPTNGTQIWECSIGVITYSSPAIGPNGLVYIGTYSSGANYLYAINSTTGEVAWQYSTGKIASSPAVGLDGTVYVGSDDTYLYAIKNNTLQWKTATGGAIISSPAIANDISGTIYVGSADKKLYAIYAPATGTTGIVKWSYTTGAAISSSPVIVSDGTVYVCSTNGKVQAVTSAGRIKYIYTSGGAITSSPAIDTDGSLYVGSADGKLYKLSPNAPQSHIWSKFHYNNSNTGLSPYLGLQTQPTTYKWAYRTGNVVESSPAIGYDGTIYVGSTDTYLYALAAPTDGSTTGVVKWSFPTGSAIKSSPAIGADGTVYVGSQAISPPTIVGSTTGVRKWFFSTGGAVTSSPAIGADGTVYVGSYDGYLYAITAPTGGSTTGVRKWEYQTFGNIRSSPAIDASGTVYIGSDDSYLYAISPPTIGTTGVLKWRFQTSGPVNSSPAIDASGTVYVGSDNGILYALAAPTDGSTTGVVKWSFPTGSAITSSPAIGDDGTVYVGSTNNILYAISPPTIGTTGVRKWEHPTGGDIFSSPAIGSDGTVYVGSYDGYLYAIGPPTDGSTTGVRKWFSPTGGNINSSPAIGVDGTIYIGSDNRNLFAFGP